MPPQLHCESKSLYHFVLQVMVNLVALSLDGCVMSTVETRLPEEGIGGLVSLKFWTCGQQNKDFSLSTVVYEPHRSGISFMRSKL